MLKRRLSAVKQSQDSSRIASFLTVAAVEVGVRAGRAVLRSHVNLWVKVFRHGGVALLARGFLGVERHFGTFNDDIVDFVFFPPPRKHNTNTQKRRPSSFHHLMHENVCRVH